MPRASLLRIAPILAVGVLVFGGCNTKPPQPSPTVEPTPALAPAPPEANRSESQSRALPRAEFSGAHDLNGPSSCGNNSLGALVLSAGFEGHFTDQVAELAPYLAFNDCVGYGDLVRTDLPDGRWLIALELPIAETSLARFAGQTHGPKPDWLSDFSDTLGVHGDVVRTRLVDTDYNVVLAGDPLDSILFSQYTARFDTNLLQHAELIPEAYIPAARTKPNAKYGFLVEQVRDALTNYPMRLLSTGQIQDPADRRWATSLEEVGAMFGGLNAAAWVNPYTGQPMVHVPFDRRSVGNYTELQDPKGVLLFFHYLNDQGGISSTIAGYRGDYVHYEGPAMGSQN